MLPVGVTCPDTICDGWGPQGPSMVLETPAQVKKITLFGKFVKGTCEF